MTRGNSITIKSLTLLTAAALGGCGFLPDHVHPVYTPTNTTKIRAARNVALAVHAVNDNPTGNKISVTKNGYDIPVSNVYINISKDFSSAIKKGLRSDGFNINKNSDVKLIATVQYLYSHESNGWSGIKQNASGKVMVQVSSNSGYLFRKLFEVNGIELKRNNLFGYGAFRSKIATELVNDMVNQIVTDPQVIDALFRAAGKTPPADLGVTVPASVSAH
ncbi:hypothetical protein HAQ00_11735 [Acidithiobacillus caldus ATCC 51756]|jgi:uncharacterized lipoprotein YajG|uniref:YajG family lipoprotein n=1 Tax=Acidithiobacillus caldus TaxID=33059 RepID=UPI001C06F55D|nr:YajG family lipoprotein [Acidithiobacillus caldus]MBU2736372.1 hypothetical protein [Acidithiobacillus caldus ATCC 51756]MBU2801770.1 hypothetical protein [Acidithiobacillus caldus]